MNKPRLIDANKLHYALIDLFQEIDNMYIAGRVISLANLQPTAYDVDKVVERLEEEVAKFNHIAKHEFNLGDTLLSAEFSAKEEAFAEAIEIVKGGAK